MTNPFTSGDITLTEQDLLAVAGVPDLNNLAPGTDLLSLVPAAVVTRWATSSTTCSRRRAATAWLAVAGLVTARRTR